MICCGDIMTLPELKKLELVAGAGGLKRVLRWVHVLDMPDVISWVQGGELLIMTGIGIYQDESALPKIVKAISRKKLAGLIINVGPYIPSIPREVLDIADSLNFPLFILPWEIKLVEVTKVISSHIVLKQMEERVVHNLLESILFSETADYSLLAGRAAQCGYEKNEAYRIAVLQIKNFSVSLQTQGINDEIESIHIKVQLKQIIDQTLEIHGCKALSLLHVDDIIFLLPDRSLKFSDKKDAIILIDIFEKISRHFANLIVQLGLGTATANMADFRTSLEQAEQSLLFLKINQSKESICFFEQLGGFKLLFKLGKSDLNSYYRETISPLADYDKVHGTELVHNLIVFFKVDNVLNQAAEQLFLHRNTLRYRLQKIEEITGRSLTNIEDRTTLQLGIMVGKILGIIIEKQ